MKSLFAALLAALFVLAGIPAYGASDDPKEDAQTPAIDTVQKGDPSPQDTGVAGGTSGSQASAEPDSKDDGKSPTTDTEQKDEEEKKPEKDESKS
jgi:hypothetical protein